MRQNFNPKERQYYPITLNEALAVFHDGGVVKVVGVTLEGKRVDSGTLMGEHKEHFLFNQFNVEADMTKAVYFYKCPYDTDDREAVKAWMNAIFQSK